MLHSRSAVTIRTHWAVLGCLLFSGVVAAQSPPPVGPSTTTSDLLAGPAVDILNNAAAVYRGATNIQLKGAKLYERHDQFVDNVSRSSFTLILTSDNRFRQEATGESGTLLQGCDGQWHWSYSARSNRYTMVAATPDPVFLFNSRVDLRFLTDGLLGAQLLRQEELQLDSGKHLCDVIQAHYDRGHPSSTLELGDVVYWIDHSSRQVWKTRTERQTTNALSGARVVAYDATEFLDVQMNLNLPDDTFGFAPPAGAIVQGPQTPAPRQALLGRPAADFKLHSLNGEEVQLSSLRGKVVVLDFWTSWSVSGRATLPKLARLVQQFQKQDVVVLAIDRYDDEQTVRAFLGSNRYEYPVLLCPRGNGVTESYSVRTVPTLVVIDRNGLVSDYRVGNTDDTEDVLRDELTRVSGPGYAPPQPAGSIPSGVYSVGNGVSAPVPTYKPDPHYSKEAITAKYEGTVVLWVTIDATGAVTDCRVIKPLGMGLDANAIDTVKTWKFNPATKEGTPVPVRVMVEVSFKLGDWAHRSH